MGGECRTHGNRLRTITNFGRKHKATRTLAGIGVDERVVLKRILKKCAGST